MKKGHLLAIFFFGGLWGLSEAGLGDILYSADVPFSSAYLTVIGFFLLAVASRFVPFPGAATAIACLAMLYKFLNVPFFACHLTGIALQGLSFDLVFGWWLMKAASAPAGIGESPRSMVFAGLKGALACYLSRFLFCVAMVSVFQYEPWLRKDIDGWWRHIGVGGSLAAAGTVFVIPLGFFLGRRLYEKLSGPEPLRLQPRWVGTLTTVVTAGIWVYGVAAKLLGKG